MKSYRKSLVTILFWLMTVCLAFSAFLMSPVKGRDVSAQATVTYDFTETSDGDNFATRGTPWAVRDGKFYTDAAWGSAYLKTAIDLTKEFTVKFDIFANNDTEDTNKSFWVGFASDETFGTFKGLLILENTVWFNNAFGGRVWVGENNTVNLFDGNEHVISITVQDNKMSFVIDKTPFVCLSGISTMDVPADNGYFGLQATNGGCYIDNLTIAEPKVDDGAIDFEAATDADLFTKTGSVVWQIENGRYSPAAESSLYSGNAVKLNQAIDLTKNQEISFDFALDKYNFDIVLLDVGAENIWGTALGLHFTEYDTTGLATLNKNIDTNGWISDYVLPVAYTDGVERNVQIIIADGKVTYFVDNVEVAMGDIPANNAYLVFRACGADTYIDNLTIAEPKVDDGAIDFETATDADLFTKTGSVVWQIENGRYSPAAESSLYSGNAVKLNQAIDLTKNQEISFDFALDKYNFDIVLLDVGAENIWGTALGLHFTEYDTTGLATLNKNIDTNGWISDYVLPVAYTDGVERNVQIIIADGKVTYFVDNVEVATGDIPANNAYLVFRACGADTYIDNLKIIEFNKSIIVKDIHGNQIDTLYVSDSVRLPMREEVGFIGYDIGGGTLSCRFCGRNDAIDRDSCRYCKSYHVGRRLYKKDRACGIKIPLFHR